MSGPKRKGPFAFLRGAEAQESAGDPDLPAAMHPIEFSQLEAIYAAVAPRRVVEWGSGGSTKAVPARFDCIERYVSVEHNANWHARVSGKVSDDRVTLLLQPPAAHDPEPEMFAGRKGQIRPEYVEWTNRCEEDRSVLVEYVEAPSQHVDACDLAFIDGRARNHCIPFAWALLRAGGVLVVHDAQRDLYRPALQSLGPAPRWLDPWVRGQICIVRKD